MAHKFSQRLSASASFSSMRTLAIDLGTRRVGLALSDESGRLASPLDVLQVRDANQALEPVLQIVSRESVERIVVGLPLNMDGTAGPAARESLRWGNALQQRCGKPVVYVDERLSSFAAEQTIIDRKRSGEKITRKQRKSRLDALAAADFLQAFLDDRLPALHETDLFPNRPE
jgi:putative holliday junction resolvase